VRVLVITGANDRFAAGAEITGIQESIAALRQSQHPDHRRDATQLVEREHDWLDWLEAQAKPVIAAIDAFALGGGLEVAMACHARVATQRYASPFL
jgi:enoyl-CoA hydratase/carnithine racemase